ncbi:MAG: tryptophan 2,3-dioxygenase [Gammaproteobacteria bacterium]
MSATNGQGTGVAEAKDYASYLALDQLLQLQKPQSRPIAADEILFIAVHQISELWFKLVLHELSGAIRDFAGDALLPAAKHLARCQAIFNQLSGVWQVLETLTPSDYQAFRPILGQASGSGSFQFHGIEYALGYRESGDPDLGTYPEATRRWLMGWYAGPSLYEGFVATLGRLGYPVPTSTRSTQGTPDPALEAVFETVYRAPHAHWAIYEVSEKLMDLEEAVQLWRFRHVRAVERIIGHLPGTGGTSGVTYLATTLERRFFPEIRSVRMRLFSSGGCTRGLAGEGSL